ncbi:MAG: gpW family head-tail joining protein [Caulobacteraceae bacterium]|nr:gpW family head-tail joining protein [Caulobacteraceae bacterium]
MFGMRRVPAELVGISQARLQTMLAQTQQAIADLTTGRKTETAAYTQADGNRSVTYTRADLASLQQRVQMLAGILYPGQGYGRRRPARPLYL